MSKTYNLVCPETKSAIWCGQGGTVYSTTESIKQLAAWLHAHEGGAVYFVDDDSDILDGIELKNWIGMDKI